MQQLLHQDIIPMSWLKELCLSCGVDDVGVVSIDRPEIDGERAYIRRALPATRTLVSLVVRMNRENLRTPSRSVANLEFHQSLEHLNSAARKIVRALEGAGYRAINPAAGFPMEMDQFPGRSWVVSHKPIAVAAGMGHMGIHRNVIHPRFGNFILLETLLLAHEVDHDDRPLLENPCMSCKLCVAACPVGAIESDGYFNFSACMNHNYREFMSGFTSWVEQIAESKDRHDYRARVSQSESASMWQSLAFGPNYKAAYCISVCPAGSEVIAPFENDRPQFLRDYLKPLQDKEEDIYVVAGSDAEEWVQKRFPRKRAKRIPATLRATNLAQFVRSLPLVFQRGRSRGIDVTYQFHFGPEHNYAITIRDRTLSIGVEPAPQPDLELWIDEASWFRFLTGRAGLLRLVLTRKLRFRGDLRKLRLFARCFPR